MKEAMVGLGLIALSIFGILLISLFGNVTVTNQQDYTAMTNTVEAAMYDAIDQARFRTGFCVCTNKEKTNGKWNFTSSSEYTISDVDEYGKCASNVINNKCELIEGDYIINKKVFAESLIRRFAESVKANNDYQLIIQDVIEYPPKVSVMVKSKNNYDVGSGEYTITNKIDSILEVN